MVLCDYEISKILEAYPTSFKLFSEQHRNIKSIVLQAIEYHTYNYFYISGDLKYDRDVIRKTITKSPSLFKNLPHFCRYDKDFCLLALRNYADNVRHFSERMREDEDIFFCILEKNFFSWHINFMSCKLRNDKKIIEKVLQKNKHAFTFIRSILKQDKEFMLEILDKYNLSLKIVSIFLLHDVDILKKAIEKDINNFLFIPQSIHTRKNVIIELYKTNPKIIKFFYLPIHFQTIDAYCFDEFTKNLKQPHEIFSFKDIVSEISTFLS